MEILKKWAPPRQVTIKCPPPGNPGPGGNKWDVHWLFNVKDQWYNFTRVRTLYVLAAVISHCVSCGLSENSACYDVIVYVTLPETVKI